MLRPVLVALLAAAALAGCDEGGDPTTIDVDTDNPRGRDVAASSGCLGCHRIGDDGNTGPGPDLTRIGARMSRDEIAGLLVNPRAPMPSYARLRDDEPRNFEALVDFLAGLR
jgi:menaquinol-cytochrome c reductase cytochrome b/c subunit